MESNARFYRRRAAEELAAARRAVTAEAQERRVQLATAFLSRLEDGDTVELFSEINSARAPVGVGTDERQLLPAQ